MAVTKASAKFVKISPRRLRQIVGLIRGKNVAAAEVVLASLDKKSAYIVEKLLKSAVANAEHNHSLEKDNLYISKICADQGPALKRFRAASMGRAAMIKKRSSHVLLELDIRKGSKIETKAKVKAKGGKK